MIKKAKYLRPENIFNAIVLNDAARKRYQENMVDNSTKYTTEVFKYNTDFITRMGKVMGMEFKDGSKSHMNILSELNSVMSKEVEISFVGKDGSYQQTMTVGEALHLWYSLKNKGTRDIVLKDEKSGIDERTIAELESKLEANEKKIMLEIGEIHRELEPILKEAMESRGEKYVSEDYYIRRTLSPEEMVRDFGDGVNTNSIIKDIFQARKDHSKSLKVTGNNPVLSMHQYIDNIFKVKYGGKAEDYYKALMRNKDFSESLDALGMRQSFGNVLQSSFGFSPASMSKGQKALDVWISAFQKIAIANKPWNTVKQASSAFTGVEEFSRLPGMEKLNDAQVAAEFLKEMGVTIANGVKNPRELYMFYYNNSELFRMREDLWFRDQHIDMSVAEAVEQYAKFSDNKKLGKVGKGIKWLQKEGRKASNLWVVQIRMGDGMGIIGGYDPIYRMAIKNGMSHEEAIKLFEKYDQTQQSQLKINKAEIQLEGGGSRLFTAFKSAYIGYYNKVYGAKIDLINEWAVNGEKYKNKRDFYYQNRRKLYKMILYRQVLNSAFGALANTPQLIYHAGEEDNWKNFWAKMVAVNVLGNAGVYMVVGDALAEPVADIVGSMTTGAEMKRYQNSYISNKIIDEGMGYAGEFLDSVQDGEEEVNFKAGLHALSWILSVPTGVPLPAFTESGEGLINMIDEIMDGDSPSMESTYQFMRAPKGGKRKEPTEEEKERLRKLENQREMWMSN